MRGLVQVLGALCALCFAAAAADTPAPQACQLKRYASLPITLTRTGRITVPIKVEGQVVNLLVDTGGYATALTDATAVRLKLQKQPIAHRDWLYGFGGGGSRYGAAANLEIAGVPITGKAFNLLSEIEPGVDGILGADILQIFDVEIDYAGGRLSLYSPDHCPGRVVYWTRDPYAVVPFDLSELQRKIRLDVDLDGHDMSTYLDTGASTSVLIYEEAIAHFDIDESVLLKDRRFPFKSLSFEGGVTVANPDIRLFRRSEALILGEGSAPDMLIGADILRQLHVYIAYKEEKLYVTGVPATATAYSHLTKGIGAEDRKDFGNAIAEYTAALETGGLIPDQQRRALLSRAAAYHLSGDCAKALDDYDRALALSPDDEEGHDGRAQVKVCLGDKSALADADLVVARDPGRRSYTARGLANWALGEFGAAAADFSKAYELEVHDPYNMVWFALSAARAGTLDRDAFTNKAAHDRSGWPGDWPTPILSVFLGKEDAESDLKDAVARDSHPDHPRQCQADFYVGEWQLAQKQVASATTLLKKAVGECPADVIELQAAKVELARLP